MPSNLPPGVSDAHPHFHQPDARDLAGDCITLCDFLHQHGGRAVFAWDPAPGSGVESGRLANHWDADPPGFVLTHSDQAWGEVSKGLNGAPVWTLAPETTERVEGLTLGKGLHEFWAEAGDEQHAAELLEEAARLAAEGTFTDRDEVRTMLSEAGVPGPVEWLRYPALARLASAA